MSSARIGESLTLLILCAGFAIAQESEDSHRLIGKGLIEL